MSERRESGPLFRQALLAGSLATGLVALFPSEARAQNMPESHMGDYFRAIDPRLDNNDGYWQQERNARDFDELEEDIGIGAGQFLQRNVLRRTFGVQTGGQMAFTTEDMYGDELEDWGARLVWRIPTGVPRRNREAFDPDSE